MIFVYTIYLKQSNNTCLDTKNSLHKEKRAALEEKQEADKQESIYTVYW